MKRKCISMLLVICLVMSFTVGCSKNETNKTDVKETSTNTSENNASTEATNEEGTKTFTDSVGRQVEVPATVTRIACSGSMSQMVLFALAPEMLVGLSGEWTPSEKQYLDTSNYDLPVLGQFYGQSDLNLEEVAKANPQVIIDVGESKDTMIEDMDSIQDQVGIPTIHIEATTKTMGEAYRTLGELLGKEEQAEELAKYCDDLFSKTQSIMDKVGEDGKTKILYCTGEDGLSVLAKGSFHAEIIDELSNNLAVLDDISCKGSGNPVDMEQLLLWDPDIILFAPGSVYSTVGEDEDWNQLTAIKNGNYYEVPNGPYNWMGTPPSVNRYMGMIWMAQLLYPQEAGYNMFEETAKYYNLFYHTQLTEEQYNSLVANSILATIK